MIFNPIRIQFKDDFENRYSTYIFWRFFFDINFESILVICYLFIVRIDQTCKSENLLLKANDDLEELKCIMHRIL